MAANESATRQSAGTAITAEQIADNLEAQGIHASRDVAEYALRLGDDALILAQRLGWWVTRAPEIEEDIALANIGLDLLGHARFLLTYAGSGLGKTEDELAYFRDEEEFRCSRLVEQPNGDFAHTIARQLLYSHYAYLLYERLQASSDATLAAIAAKAVKELDYHRDHATMWTLRLGDGTAESHERMQEGLNHMWPYLDELFYSSPLYATLGDVAVDPSTFRAEFDAHVGQVLDAATLEVPQVKAAMHDDRAGEFSEHRGYILAEMQVLARRHPGATW